MHRAFATIAALCAALALAGPAAAQRATADLPLAGGGSERVLFAGPPNPAAILVMLLLPGGLPARPYSAAIPAPAPSRR